MAYYVRRSHVNRLVMFGALVLALPARGAVRHVPADHPTIQACVDAAGTGDECLVAPGTYHETINFLGKAITLRSSGGADITIIDATGLGTSVVTCASGVTGETLLKGFTIRGGTGTFAEGIVPQGWMLVDGLVGGGMYIEGSDPFIEDCVFTANEADLGGGIYHGAGSYSLVRNCVFHNNHSRTDGGGVYNKHFLWLWDSQFVENTADVAGAGLGNARSTSAFVRGCTFTRNSATIEGGGMGASIASGSVEDCTFDGNSASVGGGGGLLIVDNYETLTVRRTRFVANTAIYGGGSAVLGDATFESCTFQDNMAASDRRQTERLALEVPRPLRRLDGFQGQGGGVHALGYGLVTLNDCQFIRNRATHGGGAFLVVVTAVFTNCIFHGNVAAESGGAVGTSLDYFNYLYLRNCVLSGNMAETGGGVCAPAYEMWAKNSTIRGNIAHQDGGGIAGNRINLTNSILWGNRGGDDHQVHVLESLYGSVRSSNIQSSGGSAEWDSASGFDDGGNLDADPLFVRETNPGDDGLFGADDDDYGDSHLLAGSPSLDMGDNRGVPTDLRTDLDGHPRTLCGQVDMGAYEFGIGDVNCDHRVEPDDFRAWESCLTGPNDIGRDPYLPGCEALDFDANGSVDLTDFAAFQRLRVDH